MVFATMRRDVRAVRDRDPAARSTPEIVLCYPGLHAVWAYRLAHRLWCGDYLLLGRFVSTVARMLTGVDIHPGATLGPGLFIDHALGVVIGETAEVGEDVTLFQGVTLGGTSLVPGKRHPSLGDRVTVGAGAKILGPIEIGHDSRIGANAVVVRPVPPSSVVVGVPGQIISRSRTASGRPDLDNAHAPDLVGVSLQQLLSRVDRLETTVDGHVTTSDIRPTTSGIWPGEDFSI